MTMGVLGVGLMVLWLRGGANERAKLADDLHEGTDVEGGDGAGEVR
jgi:hypothetical protein